MLPSQIMPVTSAVGSTVAVGNRRADFLLLTFAITATVFLGFWFTYFGPVISGTYPKASPLVHLHGWTFFAWYLLLPFQAELIRSRNVRLHRTLGYTSLALATVLVLSGVTVLGVQMRAVLANAGNPFWAASGPMIFSTMVLFVAFYSAAVVLRHKASNHKRLIVVASCAGMGAAVFRIFGVVFGHALWTVPASILTTNLFILAAMSLDFFREGRIHRAYSIGLPVCIAVELLFYFSTPTPVGQALARSLAWVGGIAGSLY